MTEVEIKALPKWPQMLVYGVRVEFDQAMEIIRRTDSFFAQDGSSGNNREWENAVCKGMGLVRRDYTWVPDETEEQRRREFRRLDARNRAWQRFHKKVGTVRTNYVHNTWLSSCYVGGPYGWCDPMGNIFYCDNVGKWPSPEEILNDWSKLAEAFPFLDLEVALMTGEQCEENTEQACAFTVRDGKATLMGHDYPTFKRYASSVEEMKLVAIGYEMGRPGMSRENALDVEGVLRRVVPEISQEHRHSLIRRRQARKLREIARASAEVV